MQGLDRPIDPARIEEPVRMAAFALAALIALATKAEPHTVSATTYYRTFSRAHPVLLRVKPGDSVATGTTDSAGVDESGERRSEPFSSGHTAGGRGSRT
jgi:hypothetical protein